MRILILGATGSIGRHLVPQALERGHVVTALVRDPAGIPARPGLQVLRGDALEFKDVERAVQGQEAVIYSLGRSRHRQPTALFSDSTRILLRAMEKHHVPRLVAITGIGAGESRGHGGFLYDKIIFPFITRQTYLDKDRQEALIRASRLDWVIVRPASFTDGPKRGSVRAATLLDGVQMKSISRADTAAFVLDQLTSDKYLRQSPLIGDPA